MKTDIVIVGCGVAGLYAALNLPENRKVLMITKSEAEDSDSFLAQGGICVLRDEDDYEPFFQDTMKAGHYENNRESVDIMIRSSRETINDLVSYGVEFARKDGEFLYTREGAHSRCRILYHEDITGKEITSHLLEQIRKRKNVTLMEYTTMIDLLVKENTCFGVVARDSKGRIFPIWADSTLLACGGIGGLYVHSTNFPHLTGDGLAVCLKHKIELLHVDYVQIHPTTLYTNKPGRHFLISESVRGEGACLYNKEGNRFTDELLPRDRLTEKILKQMEKDHMPFVWLDMRPIGEETIRNHFPHICERCLEEGYDPVTECIPIVPAQHYFMGGIKVDRHSRTSMDRLYAAGETSCNGVHGANRLASNSLLESLVFARRAALCMETEARQPLKESWPFVESSLYQNEAELQNQYKELVLKEIERMKKAHEQSDYHDPECRSAAFAGASGGYYQ